MIYLSEQVKILVSLNAVDMRCGINTLCHHVAARLKKVPQSETLFLFFNKARDRMKGLLWDRNGFILLHKRMEKNKFTLPLLTEQTLWISQVQFKALLAGFEFARMQDYPEINFEHFY